MTFQAPLWLLGLLVVAVAIAGGCTRNDPNQLVNTGGSGSDEPCPEVTTGAGTTGATGVTTGVGGSGGASTTATAGTGGSTTATSGANRSGWLTREYASSGGPSG